MQYTPDLYTQTAIDAAREAGRMIRSLSKDRVRVEEKGSPLDFVTDADRAAQEAVRQHIQRVFPGHGFLGEEDNVTDAYIASQIGGMAPEDCLWIVDPLDGTVNYIRDLSGYAVSVAMVRGGSVHCGAIYIPSDDELFYAQRGCGAYLNDRLIRVSACPDLLHAVTTTGIPPVNMAFRAEIAARLEAVSMQTSNLRIIGCAARAIAFTAAGRLDGYWEIGPHPWDVAAGILLMEEAGGVVRTLEGDAYQLGNPRILATPPQLLEPLRALLSRKEGDTPHA